MLQHARQRAPLSCRGDAAGSGSSPTCRAAGPWKKGGSVWVGAGGLRVGCEFLSSLLLLSPVCQAALGSSFHCWHLACKHRYQIPPWHVLDESYWDPTLLQLHARARIALHHLVTAHALQEPVHRGARSCLSYRTWYHRSQLGT